MIGIREYDICTSCERCFREDDVVGLVMFTLSWGNTATKFCGAWKSMRSPLSESPRTFRLTNTSSWEVSHYGLNIEH